MPDSRTDARNSVEQSQPLAPPAKTRPETDAGVEVVPLPEVLRHIGRDARANPQQYLDETQVPLGGE